tara:strand:+ start:2360 stop:2818 length:459 start_codon:yes stop_codon:yes gene_type:complete
MSAILTLIQDAIDVPMMDVKNISNIIYSYIEYEEFEGPQYDVYLDLGDRIRIYIHEAKLLAVETNIPRFSFEDGGIIFNGEDFLILGDGYNYFHQWASSCNRPDFNLVRIIDKFETRTQRQGMTAYNSSGGRYLLDFHLYMFSSMWKFHLGL